MRSDVAAQEGTLVHADELMKGCTGADDRRGNAGIERDGWDEDSPSCIPVGSHGDSSSVVSDVEAGRLEESLNAGL